jgi:hypothetical protein
MVVNEAGEPTSSGVSEDSIIMVLDSYPGGSYLSREPVFGKEESEMSPSGKIISILIVG